jgi:hypothetical protein
MNIELEALNLRIVSLIIFFNVLISSDCLLKVHGLVFFKRGSSQHRVWSLFIQLLSKAHQEPEPLLRCRIYVKTNELPSLVKDS